ncbi:MAG: tetratricopeptide repeat protein [Endomicrobiales bacterium]|nr:tetratricopeptide repeat protein [Endomicrobiales bacterium]
MTKSVLAKTALITAGLMLSVFLCEFGLRAYGVFERPSLKKSAAEFKASADGGKIKIICVGDSNTFGIGAEQGFSYPDQLQKMFDKEEPGKYKVYNLGIPGSNSSMLLKRFQGWIEAYEPHVAVVMCGMNDSWNLEDSSYFLFTKDANSLKSKLKRMLFRLKTYKLVQLAIINVKYRKAFKTPVNARGKGDRQDVIAELRTASDLAIQDPLRAKKICEEAIKDDPGNSDAYLYLGRAYLFVNDYVAAERSLKAAIEKNPRNMAAYTELSRLYIMKSETRKSREVIAKMNKVDPGSEELFAMHVFGIPGGGCVFRLLSHNLEELYKIARENDTALVLQNYPFSAPVIEEVVDDFEKRHHIPVVRNREAFDGLDYREYSVPDSHPNEKGYGIIARNVLEKVKELGPFRGGAI